MEVWKYICTQNKWKENLPGIYPFLNIRFFTSCPKNVVSKKTKAQTRLWSPMPEGEEHLF